jgi:DNA-3-methyladenine glycosylase
MSFWNRLLIPCWRTASSLPNFFKFSILINWLKWRGLTPRTKVIFGPPGHAYVYFIYGMYECLNLVAEPDGRPGCVLIRALDPLCGIATMFRRRPAARKLEDLASGPGKLTLAMGITRAHNGRDVTRGSFVLRKWKQEPPVEIEVTPRIGITKCADWPLRFVLAERRR